MAPSVGGPRKARRGASPWLRHADALWNRGVVRRMRAALRGTAALLLPVACVCCGRPDFTICAACGTALRAGVLHPRRVEQWAEALPLNPHQEPLPVLAAGSYQHELAAVILAFKNHQMPGLAPVLVPALARAVREGITTLTTFGSPVVLVPVPIRLAARSRRGYFPVGMLLKGLRHSGVLPSAVLVENLLRYRGSYQFTGAQKGKSRQARVSVRNTMQAHGSQKTAQLVARGAQVLLIDDVLTTGATLAEAQRSLADSGLVLCGAVVVAATPAPDEKRVVR